MRTIPSGRWQLLLLCLLGVISVSMGEENVSEGGGVSGGEDQSNGETEATTGEAVDGEDENDFDVTDLLPGLDEDSDNFIKNYIIGQPEFYRQDYDPPAMVPKFNNLPRFSHSSDFSKLMGDSPDDYFLGLLFIGTFICSLFVFWAIIIFILKCIGPKHVGVLAGFPFREEGQKSVAGRMILSVSAWMMIAATIVLITKGLTELQSLSDTVGMTNYDIKMIEKEVQQIVTTLQVVSAKTTPIRDELVDFLKRDICPLEPGSDTEDQVRSVGEDTYDAMIELDDFIEGYLNDVGSGVNQTTKFTDGIQGIVDMAQFTNNWKVSAVMFPYFIVPAFILVAVCMGWFDVFNEGFYTFITWMVLPMLILLTIFAIITSGWLVIFLQGNTDLCMPSPENTILNILNTVELDPDSSDGEPKDENGPSDNFFFDVMIFYTQQCTTANPWQFMEGHYADLARGSNILGEFLRSIEDTTLGQLSQECGHEYGPIVELLLQLQDLINILAQTSIRALNLMSCRNIVPIYTTAIYEATCTMSPVSMTWCLSCSIVIAFFGMLSIMFRGAYYPIDYYYYDEKDLYPTESESDDDPSNHLSDNECNDLVLEEQREQCNETIELVREEDHFDVYNDDARKGIDTDTDDDGFTTDHETATDYETATEYDTSTNPGHGESYSIGTFDQGYISMNESLISTIRESRV